jgi:hypothetical protein
MKKIITGFLTLLVLFPLASCQEKESIEQKRSEALAYLINTKDKGSPIIFGTPDARYIHYKPLADSTYDHTIDTMTDTTTVFKVIGFSHIHEYDANDDVKYFPEGHLVLEDEHFNEISKDDTMALFDSQKEVGGVVIFHDMQIAIFDSVTNTTEIYDAYIEPEDIWIVDEPTNRHFGFFDSFKKAFQITTHFINETVDNIHNVAHDVINQITGQPTI